MEQEALSIDDITYDEIMNYIPKAVIVLSFDIDYPSGYNWNYIGHRLVTVDSGYSYQSESSMGLEISVGILRLLNQFYKDDEFFTQLMQSLGLNFSDRIGAYFRGVGTINMDKLGEEIYVTLSEYNVKNVNEIIDSVLTGEYFEEFFSHSDSDYTHLQDDFNLKSYIKAQSYNLDFLELLLMWQVFYINDIYLKKGALEYSMAEMSTGEKMLLGRVCFILSNIRENSIVIIEEPEVHLNYSWIKQLVSIFIALFSEYRCHFLISSHQFPFINNLLSEQILIMEDEGVSYPEFNTLMSNNDEISYNVFKNSQNMSYIEHYIHSELNNNNTKSLKELFNILGESYTRVKVFRKLIELGEINVEN